MYIDGRLDEMKRNDCVKTKRNQTILSIPIYGNLGPPEISDILLSCHGYQ